PQRQSWKGQAMESPLPAAGRPAVGRHWEVDPDDPIVT
ncbi:hypothetical protein SCNU_16803, partial [Gordonia neofelifaecis NRRL B-59395]